MGTEVNIAKKKKTTILRLSLVKSLIGYTQRQKATARALGLRRMNQTVEQTDNPAVRGMIAKISHLLKVEEA